MAYGASLPEVRGCGSLRFHGRMMTTAAALLYVFNWLCVGYTIYQFRQL